MNLPLTGKSKGLLITAGCLLATAALLLAAAPDPAVARPHAPMEFLGVGPEMFQDRGVAWVRAFSEVVKAAISELGVIIAAVLLLLQNVRTSRTIKETKDHIDQRLDTQARRINDVALAAAPATLPVEEVTEPKIIKPGV